MIPSHVCHVFPPSILPRAFKVPKLLSFKRPKRLPPFSRPGLEKCHAFLE